MPKSTQVILITGASRGLGLSLARIFLSAGAAVAGVSRTKRFWKNARQGLDRNESRRFALFQANVSSEKQTHVLIRRVVKKFKKIDVLIHAAGYGGPLARVEDLGLKEFEKLIRHNLTSAFLLCRELIPLMRRKKKGEILLVSSMAGKRAVPRLAGYSAAKFGVVALAQAIAKENPDGKIKAVSICPGGINTDMRVALFGREDAARQQSADFVAGIIYQVVCGQIKVESGGDIVIRHGKITAINAQPGA